MPSPERYLRRIDDELVEALQYTGDNLAEARALVGAGYQVAETESDRLFATGHASPQPFLSPLDEVRWHPAQPLAPYRPRRKRVNAGAQEPLFDGEREAAAN